MVEVRLSLTVPRPIIKRKENQKQGKSLRSSQHLASHHFGTKKQTNRAAGAKQP
jgi:hypothetical protein